MVGWRRCCVTHRNRVRPTLPYRTGLAARHIRGYKVTTTSAYRPNGKGSHVHNLGAVACTKCRQPSHIKFDCDVPLSKRDCPEPERRRQAFVCTACESKAATDRRDAARALLTSGAERGELFDATTVFANMRRIL